MVHVPFLGQACVAEWGTGDKCLSDFQQVGGDWLRHFVILPDWYRAAVTASTTVRANLMNEFSHFVLFDDFSDANMTDLRIPSGPWVGCAGHGGAFFHTADQSISAHVELELWTEEPPTGEASDRRFDGRFTTDSGRVILACVTGAPSDVIVELPGPGEYWVRAIRLGEGLDEEDMQFESWRLWVWPAASPACHE